MMKTQIVDGITGESIERDMTAEELAEYQQWLIDNPPAPTEEEPKS